MITPVQIKILCSDFGNFMSRQILNNKQKLTVKIILSIITIINRIHLYQWHKMHNILNINHAIFNCDLSLKSTKIKRCNFFEADCRFLILSKIEYEKKIIIKNTFQNVLFKEDYIL